MALGPLYLVTRQKDLCRENNRPPPRKNVRRLVYGAVL